MVYLINVTPCVGVWIETLKDRLWLISMLSHPAWVCGLKPVNTAAYTRIKGHTLRGCVD